MNFDMVAMSFDCCDGCTVDRFIAGADGEKKEEGEIPALV